MPTLTWAGKENATKEANSVPYRLLERDESLCYGDATAGNVIVQGDNLAALKALMPYYRNRVRCIYIDPPYNTHSAFEHYDDGVEHSTWLSLMYPRLELLREFLAEDGSIWVNLDDNEVHYCKVILDEIFGRNNFLCDIAWEKRYSPPPDTKEFGYIHDHILVYRISDNFTRNLLPLTDDQIGRYKNPDGDPRGPWKAMDYTCRFTSLQRPNLYYPIIQPNTGEEIWPKETRVWANSLEEHEKNVRENRLWWGKTGKNRVPAKKNFLSDIQQGIMPMSLWHYQIAGTNQDAKKESLKLFQRNPFETPKPEKLISLVLYIATNPGDLVLDSFLGSGTTAAVAQKMNRHYVGIEIGEHAVTHVVPRLRKVIDGEEGGISKAENWQGGGGFSFYRLGEEVFTADGQIRKDVKFQTLAAHLWMKATDTPYGSGQPKESDSVREIMSTYGHDSPLLGIHEGTAYYLLYNGILGDRRPDGGNVLTKKVLAVLPPHDGPRIIYGESSRLHEETLKAMGIVFRQIPKEIPAN